MSGFFRKHKKSKPIVKNEETETIETVTSVVDDIDNFFKSNTPLLDPITEESVQHSSKTIDDCVIDLDNAKTIDDVECTGTAINSKIDDLVTEFQIAINKELSNYVTQKVNDEEEEMRGKVGRYYTVEEVVQLNQFKIDCVKILTQIEHLVKSLDTTFSKITSDNCEYLKSPIKMYIDKLNKLCKDFNNE